jgi:hypothetical protein
VLIAIWPYLTCPVYKKPEVGIFKGSNIYNPYSDIDSTKWLKANFHAHSRVWWGLTHGFNSEPQELVKKYKELNYNVIGLSDYMHINELSSIPVYEHGVGIFKNHQLSVGAGKILWKEYLFWQSFHNKQNIISELREENNLISINHPILRSAYDGEDLKLLQGYDLLEVVNHNYSHTLNLWDTVLSAGKMVFLIVNDDTHDITNPKDFGYAFTMINSNNNNSDIIEALRTGKSYGVEMEPQGDFSPAKKLEQARTAPTILNCSVQNDTITFNFDKNCDTIKLFGQNGVILQKANNIKSIKYRLRHEDTYVRAEVNQANSVNVFLNPLFRYDKLEALKNKPETDLTMTWILRSVYICAAFLIIFLLYRRKKMKRLIR